MLFSSTEEEHAKDVVTVLQRLTENNLFSKASKQITSLTSLLKEESPFIFDEEALSLSQLLKEALTTAPITSRFNHSLPTNVETDASDYALGDLLSHVNDSGNNPIEFDSHKLLPAELNYEIHEKELLGIVWALKH
ncbi:hypothetical protein O181_130163 [Austropuccinia psidii MF-1]|uniref:Reverse transcriptase/retrotransposon-derived protein RNase H-like domain-containing protein n=1 Tax=Austropuccinia psidii MF-1 TaxID=1389203 RepID=A0A9Q3Q9I4_9BASI|nr:hypothetical protein [Austropuccinia psidii MF-1]